MLQTDSGNMLVAKPSQILDVVGNRCGRAIWGSNFNIIVAPKRTFTI